MFDKYERKYVDALKQSKMSEGLSFFESERNSYLKKENFENYLIASVYFNRLQLLLSRYNVVKNDIKRIRNLEWYSTINPFLKARLLLIKAKLNYSNGNYRKAEQYTWQALKKVEKYSNTKKLLPFDSDYFFCRVHMVFAKIEWRRRDTYRAKLYMALSWHYYYKGPRFQDHYLPARLQCHFGQIYSQEGDIKKAEAFFDQSEELYRKNGYKEEFYLSETLSLKALCELSKKNHEQAKAHIDSALAFLGNVAPESMHRFRASLFQIMGKLYIAKFDDETTSSSQKRNYLDLASKYLTKDLKLRKQLFKNKKHNTIARIQNQISYIHTKNKEYDLAILEAKKALGANNAKINDFNDLDELNKVLNKVGSLFYYLESMKRISEAYLGKYKDGSYDNKASDLRAAWRYVDKCQKIVNAIRKRYYGHESKVNVGSYGREVFELAMEVLMEKKHIGKGDTKGLNNTIFEVFKNSKSYVLHQTLHPFSVPSLIAKAPQSKKTSPEFLRRLMNKIEICFSSGFKQPKINATLIQYFLGFESKEDKLNSLNHPTLTDVRSELNRDGEPGAIVSYFLGKKGLYAIIINGKIGFDFQCLIFGAEKIRTLKQEIHELVALFDTFPRKLVNKPIIDSITGDPIQKNLELLNYSQSLYQSLIKPLHLTSETERLYIIPDEELFMVPFCFLSSPVPGPKPVNFSELKYVSLIHKISYHISTYLLYKNHVRNKVSLERSAFEKVTELENSLLFNLPGRIVERGVIDLIFNTRNFLAVRTINGLLRDLESSIDFSSQEVKASNLKLELQRNSEKVCILHFFGHSYHEDENHLLLEENRDTGEKTIITQGEIQSLNLKKSKLILINACTAGQGALGKGEAPVSIFQAFLKAGAKNVFYSLFGINQKDAKEFTTQFISRLKKEEGNSFIDALTHTKRSFIDNIETSHPTAWASPSFIGNQMETL